MRHKFVALLLTLAFVFAGNTAFAASYGFPKAAEDAAHTSADSGFPVWGVRTPGNDTAQTSADGDYGAIAITQYGNPKVQVEPSTAKTFTVATVPFTPAASATDISELFYGSKKVKILRIVLSYKGSPTAADFFYLQKRGSANSGGTSATPTVVPLDSANTATAVVKNYTANPTVNSTVGTISCMTVGNLVTNSSGVGYNVVLWDAATMGGPIVLNATGQGVGIWLNGTTISGIPTVAVSYTWIEEP